MRQLEYERLDQVVRQATAILAGTHYLVAGREGKVAVWDGQPFEDPEPKLKALKILLGASELRGRYGGLFAPQVKILEMATMEDAQRALDIIVKEPQRLEAENSRLIEEAEAVIRPDPPKRLNGVGSRHGPPGLPLDPGPTPRGYLDVPFLPRCSSRSGDGRSAGCGRSGSTGEVSGTKMVGKPQLLFEGHGVGPEGGPEPVS